jgi:prepilin-type N-terminal cleavage/methylation domain-containing protein
MNRTRRKGSAHEEGFTLIELLLVVIILGVLSTVVVISVRGISDRGGTSACEASRATIRASLESYFAMHATYPTDLGLLGSEFIEDVDRVVHTGPAPYSDTLEGGPGKWTFHYTYTGPTAFELSTCISLR